MVVVHLASGAVARARWAKVAMVTALEGSELVAVAAKKVPVETAMAVTRVAKAVAVGVVAVGSAMEVATTVVLESALVVVERAVALWLYHSTFLFQHCYCGCIEGNRAL